MALPPEVETLRALIARREGLDSRRAALLAEEILLQNDFEALFVSGALGVSEARKTRLVHLETRGRKVRLIAITWNGLVNGANHADAQIVEVDEEQPTRPVP